MQQITDQRRQTAATAAGPLGLRTSWERVWWHQVAALGSDLAALRQKVDNSYLTPIQDLDPASGSFGKYIGPYEDPYGRGPL